MNPMQMQKMMKEAQKMQSNMKKAQDEIAAKEFVATAGGSMVEVKANGEKKILGININKEVIDPEDKEMLEDLILIAMNDVLTQVEEFSEEKMGSITGGMGIPGGLF